MRCPRCVQHFYQAADSCPHCGFQASDAGDVYGHDSVSLKKLTDAAGVFRLKDRELIRRELKRFERIFPQLFFAIYTEAFEEMTSIRQYGFWLLNHAAFEDVDIDRPNECCVLLVVDANAKTLSLNYGYSLLPYLDEESTFEVLSVTHAFLLEGEWGKALKAVLRKMTQHLKKKHDEVWRNPDKLLDQCGQRLREHDEKPKPVRQGHVKPNVEEEMLEEVDP